MEHKQTTLCSQFLEIDCDVNWSEEDDATAIIDYEQYPDPDPDPDLDKEAVGDDTPTVYDALVKDETEFHESYLKVDPKAAAAHKFPCMFCEKSFKMRRYLEEHVATHTGDRPIACAYCNMAFRCRSNMYTHVKTKHTTQWQKARAERESAKINSNNNVQIQRTINGDNSDKPVDALMHVPPSEPKSSTPQPTLKINAAAAAAAAASPVPAAAPAAPALPAPNVLPSSPNIVSIKSEPMEAINLTVSKTCPTPAKRVTRSSRRKTHSPKKVQHTARSASASEDSSNEELADVHEKRFKSELQTCKENELLLANYNAVAAVVAAATQQQQQRFCATIMQQHQEQLLTAMAAVSTSTSSAAAAAAAAAAVALASQSRCVAPGQILAQSLIAFLCSACSTPAVAPATAPANVPAAEPYTCSICGQQLRNQRALKNHLHNKHNAATSTTATATASTSSSSPSLALPICANCGELPGQNHRCLSKAKYACDVCGKSFKMKRYLEVSNSSPARIESSFQLGLYLYTLHLHYLLQEHFATHTGVKLHTCAFCPTEFRSKSNMYHHTKRKHKLEWERSRASRTAAKSAAAEQQPEQEHEHEQLDDGVVTNS